MENQKANFDSTELSQTWNSPLAILFFAFGALHIYGFMRSRATRRKLVKGYNLRKAPSNKLSKPKAVLGKDKNLLGSSAAFGNYLKIGISAVVVAGIIEIFVF
ncbi:MAG: hypothetical protein F6K58_06035 [Symploca sp. SIO2E9]|nr:hypothetical protein [Symploca sp. SIO2E9]